jgi:hypothetical protein
VLQRKLSLDATPIEQLVPLLPQEVSALCMRLLSRDPAQRPRGEEVLSVLHAHTLQVAPRSLELVTSFSPGSRSKTEAELSLIGREDELAQLWAAFREVQAGKAAAVHVYGESGAGKSLLLHHFCDEVARGGFLSSESQPLVLRSRCYERETLPFKALDGAMDALVNHLSREADIVVSHVLPRSRACLPRAGCWPVPSCRSACRKRACRPKMASMICCSASVSCGLWCCGSTTCSGVIWTASAS